MLLPAARHTLARLLLLALFSNLFVPMAPQASAVTTTAPQPAFPVIAPQAMPRPIASARAPQLDVTPANLPAHAALPPTPRSIGQRLPLTFVPNVGQTDTSVRYQARGMGGSIFFTPREIVLTVPSGSNSDRKTAQVLKANAGITATRSISMSVVRLRYEGMDANAQLTAIDRLPGTANYLTGRNKANWHATLPMYAGVVYQQLYPGIDLHYTDDAGSLKSIYTLAPNADPNRIRWRYTGVLDPQIDTDGNLILRVPAPGVALKSTAGVSGTLTEQAPRAWQQIDGRRVPIAARYTIAANGDVGFTLGAYESKLPLVIDPSLTYSTYLGGNADEAGCSIATDDTGAIYVAGYTSSTDFPTSSPISGTFTGYTDIFITKLTADGSAVVYSTYLGGSGNDGYNRLYQDLFIGRPRIQSEAKVV